MVNLDILRKTIRHFHINNDKVRGSYEPLLIVE